MELQKSNHSFWNEWIKIFMLLIIKLCQNNDEFKKKKKKQEVSIGTSGSVST